MITWQIRASDEPRAVPFVGEARLWARRGETGVTGNVYVGLHEFEAMAFVAHLLRPGDWFLDAGANAGSYSVLGAAVAGAHVIAVEPIAGTAARLRANLELNGIIDRVEVVASALGDREGEAVMTADADTTNQIIRGEEPVGAIVHVPMTTVDSVVKDRPIRCAKIDVEGYDVEVLAGAPRMLANPALSGLVVELSESAERRGQSLVRLEALGFRPAQYDPFSRRLKEARRSGGGNQLFVRGWPEVAARLAEAPPLRVKGLLI